MTPISGHTTPKTPLVQQTTAEYLEQELGWESVHRSSNLFSHTSNREAAPICPLSNNEQGNLMKK